MARFLRSGKEGKEEKDTKDATNSFLHVCGLDLWSLYSYSSESKHTYEILWVLVRVCATCFITAGSDRTFAESLQPIPQGLKSRWFPRDFQNKWISSRSKWPAFSRIHTDSTLQEEIDKIFRLFDTNGNGFIVWILRFLGCKCRVSECHLRRCLSIRRGSERCAEGRPAEWFGFQESLRSIRIDRIGGIIKVYHDT